MIMVNEKEFRKQIRSAYYDVKPTTKRYLIILAVVIILVAAIIVFESLGPSESEIAKENVRTLLQNSKDIVSEIRQVIPAG